MQAAGCLGLPARMTGGDISCTTAMCPPRELSVARLISFSCTRQLMPAFTSIRSKLVHGALHLISPQIRKINSVYLCVPTRGCYLIFTACNCCICRSLVLSKKSCSATIGQQAGRSFIMSYRFRYLQEIVSANSAYPAQERFRGDAALFASATSKLLDRNLSL